MVLHTELRGDDFHLLDQGAGYDRDEDGGISALLNACWKRGSHSALSCGTSTLSP